MSLNLEARIGLDTKQFNKAAKKSSKVAKTSFKDVAKAAAAIFAVNKARVFSKEVREWSGRMIDFADASGASVKTVQKLDIAARQAGTTFDKISLSARTLGRTLADPKMKETLDALGIDPGNFKGLDELAQLEKFIEKFQGSQFSGSDLTNVRRILGDDFATMRQLFQQGISTGVPLIDRETLQSAKDFDGAVQNLTDRLKAFFAILQAPILDLLTGSIGKTNDGLDTMSGGLDKLRVKVETFIGFFADGFDTLFNSWRAISEAIGKDLASFEETAKGFGKALRGDFAGSVGNFRNARNIRKENGLGATIDSFSELQRGSRLRRDTAQRARFDKFASARESVRQSSFTAAPTASKTKESRSAAFSGDSLREVGGFIGVGPVASPLISKIDKSNQLLEKIARNTDPKIIGNMNKPNRDAGIFK